MKIIKQFDTNNWSVSKTCSKCDIQLEIDSGDIKYKYEPGDIRDPGYDCYFCACAICNNVIYILAENIPKAVQFLAKKKK